MSCLLPSLIYTEIPFYKATEIRPPPPTAATQLGPKVTFQILMSEMMDKIEILERLEFSVDHEKSLHILTRTCL